jgi:hypothetical protein
MARIKNQKFAGGAILFGSLVLFGKETVAWAWSKALDTISNGAANVTITAIPWQNLIASLMGFIGLALLFWPVKRTVVNRYAGLSARGFNVLSRLRQHRETPRILKQYHEPLEDIVLDGMSTLKLFEKQGLAIPDFRFQESERAAVCLEAYFTSACRLLRDAHYDILQNEGQSIAKLALSEGEQFNPQDWYNNG